MAGAASGVLWQVKQAGLPILIGRERTRYWPPGVAGDHRFLLGGVVAKAIDDVGFPIHGSIVEIGWI